MPNFRFRLPSIVDLTITQQIAFTNRENSMLVTGGPGSGKTVVTIYRYRREVIDKKVVIFFTHHRTLIASIRGILRQEADILFPDLNEEQLRDLLENLRTVTYWYRNKFDAYLPSESDESILKKFSDIQDPEFYNFDEIFIDEAQDLKPIIIEGMIMLADKLTIGTDRSQDLNGQFVIPPEESIRVLLENDKKEIDHQELTQNFRNTKQIFEFARKFVPEDIAVQEINTTELSDGEDPILMNISWDEQLNLIVRIIRENPNSNIGILVHFYWQINIIRDYLINNGFSCERGALEQNSFSYYYVHPSMNKEHRDLMERNLHTPFIITFDSCKGLEFDIVIMPMFERSDWAMTNSKKKNGTEENDTNADGSLKYYTNRNHYYVACTRARGLLYILYEKKPNILSFYNENGEQ